MSETSSAIRGSGASSVPLGTRLLAVPGYLIPIVGVALFYVSDDDFVRLHGLQGFAWGVITGVITTPLFFLGLVLVGVLGAVLGPVLPDAVGDAVAVVVAFGVPLAPFSVTLGLLVQAVRGRATTLPVLGSFVEDAI